MTKSPEFIYLEQVLGIENFILPDQFLQDRVEGVNFLVQINNPQNKYAIEEMVNKIITALGAYSAKISVNYFSDQIDSAIKKNKNIIIFSDLPPLDFDFCLSLPSFELMLKKPELKKTVWLNLKSWFSK